MPESLCLSFRPVGFNEQLVADTIQVLLEGFVLKLIEKHEVEVVLNVVFSLKKCVRLYRMYFTCLNSGELSLHTNKSCEGVTDKNIGKSAQPPHRSLSQG